MKQCGTMLYLMDADIFLNQEKFARGYAMVSPERREKIDRFRFPKDKNLSLAAGILLQRALQLQGTFCEEVPELSFGKNGKPYLKNGNGLFFNLSHAGHYAACAVSDTEVGCDIEEIRRNRMDVARRFFAPEEQRVLEECVAEALQDRMFFRLWTLKESFVKATGDGLYFPFTEFDVSPVVRNHRAEITADGGEESYYFSEFREIPGFCCAICSKGKPCEDAGLQNIFF